MKVLGKQRHIVEFTDDELSALGALLNDIVQDNIKYIKYPTKLYGDEKVVANQRAKETLWEFNNYLNKTIGLDYDYYDWVEILPKKKSKKDIK